MTAGAAEPGFDRALCVERALRAVRALGERLEGAFPSGCTRGLRYEPAGNQEWTPGFWSGILWLAYRHTGDGWYRAAAEALLPSFAERLGGGGPAVETHDLGFLYTLSAVAAWKTTGDAGARALALRAADLLSRRHLPGAGVFQAWGPLDDPDRRGLVIIDSAMNMPLLFWAAREGERPGLGVLAAGHLRALARHLVREDGSTGQTCRIDPVTGRAGPVRTHQGRAADSAWARGQAWALYGFALAHRHTGEDAFRDVAARVADYFVARLPRDGVAFWDLSFGEGDAQEKDTSASAIAAAGLLELGERFPPADPRRAYTETGERMLAALSAHQGSPPSADGLLLHAVYDRPRGLGVGESCLWGDYFYLEALLRTERAAPSFF